MHKLFASSKTTGATDVSKLIGRRAPDIVVKSAEGAPSREQITWSGYTKAYNDFADNLIKRMNRD